MRIGILQADAVSAELAARHGDYPDMFRALLGDPQALPPGGRRPEFVAIDARSPPLPAADACDGYVITGSRHSVYDRLPWIAPLADFVDAALRAGRRVVGICFGHQLIAHFFGGETRAAEAGWCVGVQPARVIARAPWQVPAADRFALCVSHQDQVLRLPPEARLFAVGERCPYAGFVLPASGPRRAEALTLQGHPEFSRAYTGALMEQRRQQLGAAVYGAGQASLAEAVDTRLVAGWMLRFLVAPG